MSLLTQVEDRLKAAAMPPLKQVEGAASFAALAEAGKRPMLARQPAGYVIPVGERAQATRLRGATLQEISVRFGVVLARSHANDPTGEQATRAIDQDHRDVRDQLIGWSPEGYRAVVYTSGRLMGFAGGYAWWLAEYETVETTRKT